MSAFMDAGWRVASGQEPYVDFFYIAGPIHLYLHALSFLLLGFGKTAILVHLCTVTAAMSLATFVIARTELSRTTSAALSLFSAIALAGPVSHPWYDQTAMAFAALALAIWEISRRASRDPARKASALLAGGLLALSFFTKTNVGAAAGAVTLVLFFLTWRGALIWMSLGYVGVATAVLATLESPRDFVYDTFFAFQTADRLVDVGRLYGSVVSFRPHLVVLSAVVVLAIVGGRSYLRSQLTRFAAVLGVWLVAVFSQWTGSMLPSAYTLLLGLMATYLGILVARWPSPVDPSRHLAQRLARLVVSASVLWLAGFVLEKSFALEAWRWRQPWLPVRDDYALRSAALSGWRCDRRIGEAFDLALEQVAARAPRDESLLVFPAATVAYGALGRPSFPGVPFIFHLRVVPPPGEELERFRSTLTGNPPRWILLFHQSETWFYDTAELLRWLQLEHFVRTRYRTVWQHGGFALLQLASGPRESQPGPAQGLAGRAVAPRS